METITKEVIKAWKLDGKKYPLETYLVTECSCGCTNRV